MRRAMRLSTLILVLFLAVSSRGMAGPREFGLAELDRALAARHLPGVAGVVTGLRPGPPESFRVEPGRVVGADERGLMFGLLAAAEQIRATGRLAPLTGAPHTAIRGIRYFLHNQDLEAGWYYDHEQWNAFFAMLARARFNRFNLVFAHQTAYLVPPYPYWLELPEFPQVRVPGLGAAQRERNLATLCFIAQAAADHGIDFTLGIWEHDVQAGRGMRGAVLGLTADDLGPYSYAALKQVLDRCQAIRSVQLRTGSESGIPRDRELAFYRDYVFRAISEANHRVGLDLRGWDAAGGILAAAGHSGLKLRVSAKYWAEDLGRPYQPVTTFKGYSYGDLLREPRSYSLFWELWGLGSHRLLLWGNPDYVRRTVGTFGLGGGEGFEIDPPLAQKGFGNAPGRWGVFTAPELARRRFWRWEWERYWLFYELWGRLGYDPTTPDTLWQAELDQRFGAAAGDVLTAYRNASEVLNEIVAVHLADPNMYLWPEINPGGLIDAYKDVRPSDRTFVASIREAAGDRLEGRSSARQKPERTAARLDHWAEATERAVAAAATKMTPGNREWLSSEPDFDVLALLARYHACKQRAAEALVWFDATADGMALRRAHRELDAAVAIWERLVRLTDGLYPDEMAYGPADIGSWKDKLPYVRHDLEAVREREQVFRTFGRFARGFDFGGPVASSRPADGYDRDPYVLRNTVAPRFTSVDPATRYTAATGYGWLETGRRKAVAIRPTPYLEVRAVARHPRELPHDVLFRDGIEGVGRQAFAVAAGPGEHTVLLLHHDHTVERRHVRAAHGRLLIRLPQGKWRISGLVVDPDGPPPSRPAPIENIAPPRPTMQHEPVTMAPGGRAMTLRLTLPTADAGDAAPRTVLLHYRPLDQRVPVATLAAPAGHAVFTIPASAITGRNDLLYFFEILDRHGGGWFLPDPLKTTPYYVVHVR